VFVLRRIPALLALLLLGALSLRLGLAPLIAAPVAVGLVVLLFIPAALLQTLLAAVLWAGVLAWAGMAWLRTGERLAAGLPWPSSPPGPRGCCGRRRTDTTTNSIHSRGWGGLAFPAFIRVHPRPSVAEWCP
jgi:hypothetical protein